MWLLTSPACWHNPPRLPQRWLQGWERLPSNDASSTLSQSASLMCGASLAHSTWHYPPQKKLPPTSESQQPCCSPSTSYVSLISTESLVSSRSETSPRLYAIGHPSTSCNHNSTKIVQCGRALPCAPACRERELPQQPNSWTPLQTQKIQGPQAFSTFEFKANPHKLGPP